MVSQEVARINRNIYTKDFELLGFLGMIQMQVSHVRTKSRDKMHLPYVNTVKKALLTHQIYVLQISN